MGIFGTKLFGRHGPCCTPMPFQGLFPFLAELLPGLTRVDAGAGWPDSRLAHQSEKVPGILAPAVPLKYEPWAFQSLRVLRIKLYLPRVTSIASLACCQACRTTGLEGISRELYCVCQDGYTVSVDLVEKNCKQGRPQLRKSPRTGSRAPARP